MSGGSYDYVFSKIEDIEIQGTNISIRRRMFQTLLKKVANAMHDIEWVDSGDYGEGEENGALDACFACFKMDNNAIEAYKYRELKDIILNYFKDEDKL